MDRIDAMRLFVAVVEEGSLAKGGHRLSHSPASVSRAISGLEAIAGERLLHRSARGMKLTDAGERHLAVFRHILSDLDSLGRDQAPQKQLRGTVRVAASEMFGRLEVLPVAESFLDAHPGASIRMVLHNEITNLVDDGTDVAIRIAVLPDSGLSAVKLGTMRQMLCASPDYLRRHGTPQVPADLRHHACIGRDVAGDRDTWPFRFETAGRARVRSIAVPSRLWLNSLVTSRDVARSGRGIGRYMAYQVADDVTSGRLVRLLPGHEIDPLPVHLLFDGGIRQDGVVRAFIDHATPLLRRRLESLLRRIR